MAGARWLAEIDALPRGQINLVNIVRLVSKQVALHAAPVSKLVGTRNIRLIRFAKRICQPKFGC